MMRTLTIKILCASALIGAFTVQSATAAPLYSRAKAYRGFKALTKGNSFLLKYEVENALGVRGLKQDRSFESGRWAMFRSGLLEVRPRSKRTRERNMKMDEVVAKLTVQALRFGRVGRHMAVNKHTLLLALETYTARLKYEQTAGRARARETQRNAYKRRNRDHLPTRIELIQREADSAAPARQERAIKEMTENVELIRTRLAQESASALRSFDRKAERVRPVKAAFPLVIPRDREY